MILGSMNENLCLADWYFNKRREANDHRICKYLNALYEEGNSHVIAKAVTMLDEYFKGNITEFTIPLHLAGTEFQCRVWKELMKIPYGMTFSYSEIARKIDNPHGVRAVATAIACNPISIFIPCHRIIGCNGKLTGYAGGTDAKTKLLDLEASISNKTPFKFT